MRHKAVPGRLRLVAIAVLVALAGCSQRIDVMQWPAFLEHRDIHTIAVAPFHSTTPYNPDSGKKISALFTAALSANGTYDRVYSFQNLQPQATGEQVTAESIEDVAARLRALPDVQAVIIATVVDYGVTSHTELHYQPYYYNRPYGYGYGRGYGYGYGYYGSYRFYSYTANDAIVAVTAQMISSASGESIHTMAGLAKSFVRSYGSPPSLSREACLAVATEETIAQLLDEFAVVPKTIKVKPKETFFTSTGELQDSKWTRKNKFAATDERMAVIVNLPVQASHNSFRIVIMPEHDATELADETFTWSRDNPPTGVAFDFNPRELAEAGGGPGDYVARLYVGSTLALTHEFEIKKAE